MTGETSPGNEARAETTAARSRRRVAQRPPHRRLRVFASDPTLRDSLETLHLSEATVAIPWEGTEAEPLRPGPVGEYVEVVDVDPASGCAYEPIDLNDPFLLASDGLSPSESEPQFHQQMVYAVAMTTIGHFERALGRVALWGPHRQRWTDAEGKTRYRDDFVRRLRIYPHALREANAYYSPAHKALLFGYFPTDAKSGSLVPGTMVFTCLSHDVIAHETTHALLDGLHRRFQESTNPDVAAFHEAFADIVAIFQHFSLPGLLEQEIRGTRGDLGVAEYLASLARQFGQGVGRSKALRSAIGEAGGDYRSRTDPHDRGAILVSAVFAAYLGIYRRRSDDLFRIATGGTGVLEAGAIHPDLVGRLAAEARKAASHVLRMCIRALDYCPPVDITFGEYLRAIITADSDLVPDDDIGYRTAFLEAFRARGIYPDDLRTISTESLRWQEPTFEIDGLPELIASLDLGWDLASDRRQAHEHSLGNNMKVHEFLSSRMTETLSRQLGLDSTLGPGGTDRGHALCEVFAPEVPDPRFRFEVHSVRPARRVAPDGSFVTDLVVVVAQRRCTRFSEASRDGFFMRGGSTLLIDTRKGRERVRYCISKSVTSSRRRERQSAFMGGENSQSLASLYFGDGGGEPFALLHRGF
ncbi:hypothetical protein C8J46_101839 [Sphingomonas sp. PP-F2F-A104-K0414]|uniref:hypothetical protein n=1 Tax=Sphingomonas sp. PP-F2F-A104-K0414 TaxID=2135661 RepID=UPI001051B95E|nr:hypothetical protein [Sphingomonas sp. PP-F2F-A104-K0414]TCQ01471.1 hypothetical protein C8J46_101839 [Sphingomonas sp. PP-F2F-A104-K0414]